MKPIYLFDQITKKFVGVTLIADSDVVSENATAIKPTDGLYDPTWNGKDWVGKTLDEFVKDNPPADPEPNQQEQINVALTQELAQTKAELKTANDGIVALTKMVAEMKGAQA